MNHKKDIFPFFKKDRNQKLIYGIGLLLWILLWYDDFRFISNDTITFYVVLTFIPALLLFLQILFNNRIIWWLLVVYFGIHTLSILWSMVYFDILIDYHRDYLPQSFWRINKLRNWLIMLPSLFLVNWTIWKIKP